MFVPRNLQVAKLLMALAVLLACTGSASAYVGPGPGLELIGYSLGLLMWVVGAFSAVALWPICALIRKIRGETPQTPSPMATAPEEQREETGGNPVA